MFVSLKVCNIVRFKKGREYYEKPAFSRKFRTIIFQFGSLSLSQQISAIGQTLFISVFISYSTFFSGRMFDREKYCFFARIQQSDGALQRIF